MHLNETCFICFIALIFDLDEFCRKTKQNDLPLGWKVGYPLYLKSHQTIPMGLSGYDFQYARTGYIVPLPSGIFNFLCTDFYMWTAT